MKYGSKSGVKPGYGSKAKPAKSKGMVATPAVAVKKGK